MLQCYVLRTSPVAFPLLFWPKSRNSNSKSCSNYRDFTFEYFFVSISYLVYLLWKTVSWYPVEFELSRISLCISDFCSKFPNFSEYFFFRSKFKRLNTAAFDLKFYIVVQALRPDRFIYLKIVPIIHTV